MLHGTRPERGGGAGLRHLPGAAGRAWAERLDLRGARGDRRGGRCLLRDRGGDRHAQGAGCTAAPIRRRWRHFWRSARPRTPAEYIEEHAGATRAADGRRPPDLQSRGPARAPPAPAGAGGGARRRGPLANRSPTQVGACVAEHPHFVRRQLNPNVEFYSAPLLYTLGLPLDLFTVAFAISRIAGWIGAHPRATGRQPADSPQGRLRRAGAARVRPAGRAWITFFLLALELCSWRIEPSLRQAQHRRQSGTLRILLCCVLRSQSAKHNTAKNRELPCCRRLTKPISKQLLKLLP